MGIPRRESQFCKSQQAHDEYKCTHDLCKSAYQAWHNEARRGKMTVSKNEVLKAKSACQAAATAAHQVEPSGPPDGDFCRESSDENQISEKAIKNKTAKNQSLLARRLRQQKAKFESLLFYERLKDMILPNTSKTKARDTRRGPLGSTINIS